MSKNTFDIHQSVGSALRLLESFGVDKDAVRDAREHFQEQIQGPPAPTEHPEGEEQSQTQQRRAPRRRGADQHKTLDTRREDVHTSVSENVIGIPYQVFDEITRHQTLAEQAVYMQLLRKSLGRGSRSCAVSQRELMERTGISSLVTLRTALRGLIEKHYMTRVHHHPPSTTIYEITLSWNEISDPSKNNPLEYNR
jgi:hypothetical protein